MYFDYQVKNAKILHCKQNHTASPNQAIKYEKKKIYCNCIDF